MNLHIDINEEDSEWYEILIMYRIFSTMLRKLEFKNSFEFRNKFKAYFYENFYLYPKNIKLYQKWFKMVKN